MVLLGQQALDEPKNFLWAVDLVAGVALDQLDDPVHHAVLLELHDKLILLDRELEAGYEVLELANAAKLIADATEISG